MRGQSSPEKQALNRWVKQIEQMGEAVLDLVVHIASGEVLTKAELNSQEDFIPWKRGVSL